MVGISSCNEVGSERWIDEVVEDILVIGQTGDGGLGDRDMWIRIL